MRKTLKSIKNAIKKPYYGAGVLLVASGPRGLECFLGQRKKSGIWSLMGGGAEPEDSGDLKATAFRELAEEARTAAGPLSLRETTHPVADTISFDAPFYHWETFIVRVDREEFEDIQLDPQEFTSGRWFPVNDLPPGTHRFLKWPFMLWPALCEKLTPLT